MADAAVKRKGYQTLGATSSREGIQSKWEAKRQEQDFTYEHFPVVCPTCKGHGEIFTEDEGMVTFVPVKDERLRPAWTKVKIAVVLGTILLFGGLTTFLVYPREVTLTVQDHEALHWNFLAQDPWIVIQVNLIIENKNYFAVTLNDTKLQVLFMQTIVAKKCITDDIKVSLHATKTVSVSVNITYPYYTTGPGKLPGPGFYLKKQCFEQRYYVAQGITAFSELSYWIHDEHIESVDDYFYIDCSKLIFPFTDSPQIGTQTPLPTMPVSTPKSSMPSAIIPSEISTNLTSVSGKTSTNTSLESTATRNPK